METPRHWTGIGEIWTADAWHVGMRCSLHLEPGRATMSTTKKSITFVPEEITELRRFHLPLPSVTAIFKNEGDHALISFSVARGQLLETALAEVGFPVTEVRRWRTGLEARSDQKRYGLQS